MSVAASAVAPAHLKRTLLKHGIKAAVSKGQVQHVGVLHQMHTIVTC